MPELLLLVGDLTKARNDNHLRFSRGFERAGWKVASIDHDGLEVRANRLLIAGREPASFDLIWPLGFGPHGTFFDRMQLLQSLTASAFVTSPDALLYLHGKHRWLERMPETHTSAAPDYLYSVVSAGGDWILKPTAGSYGRDVQLVKAGDASLEQIRELCAELGYLMAQRFIPEVANGEKRTLIAAGTLIGTYKRIPAGELTSNLAAGGRAVPARLTAAERLLVEPIARELADLGAGFASIDTVHPHLMEVNVANPGGLETLEQLDGEDLTDAVVRAIIDALMPA